MKAKNTSLIMQKTTQRDVEEKKEEDLLRPAESQEQIDVKSELSDWDDDNG